MEKKRKFHQLQSKLLSLIFLLFFFCVRSIEHFSFSCCSRRAIHSSVCYILRLNFSPLIRHNDRNSKIHPKAIFHPLDNNACDEKRQHWIDRPSGPAKCADDDENEWQTKKRGKIEVKTTMMAAVISTLPFHINPYRLDLQICGCEWMMLEAMFFIFAFLFFFFHLWQKAVVVHSLNLESSEFQALSNRCCEEKERKTNDSGMRNQFTLCFFATTSFFVFLFAFKLCAKTDFHVSTITFAISITQNWKETKATNEEKNAPTNFLFRRLVVVLCFFKPQRQFWLDQTHTKHTSIMCRGSIWLIECMNNELKITTRSWFPFDWKV